MDDPQVSKKLQKIIKLANENLLETLGHAVILKQQLSDPDTTIASMKEEIQELRDQNDDLEQYGRRKCLRIKDISDTEGGTTASVIKLANKVLKVDIRGALHQRDSSTAQAPPPPLCPASLSTPHHHTFQQKANRDRAIKERKVQKGCSENTQVKIYINEDLSEALWYCPKCVRSTLAYNHIDADDVFLATTRERIINDAYRLLKSNKLFMPFRI